MKFFMFMTMFVSLSCAKRYEPEEYHIPSGYIGRVVIVFNKNDGLDKLYEEGKRIYKIRSNGVLFSKFQENEGVFSANDVLFYYVNEDGIKSPIYELRDREQVTNKDSIMIFSVIQGGKGTRNGPFSKMKEFIVDTVKNISKYTPFDFRTDSLEKKWQTGR